ncbi:MAG: ABC transporter permease [Bacteroidia bacterium]|nr:ABC transporter permease [Bacteroidia bacterium]
MKKRLHTERAFRWSLFLRSKAIRFALGWLLLVLLAAVFADMIAREGGWVPYGTEVTTGHGKIPPLGAHSHYLGTDPAGHDVLAGLIHGARISLAVGFGAVGLAAFIGILMGLLAGYWANDRLRLRRGVLISLVPGVFCGWFYGFRMFRFALNDAAEEGVWPFLGQVGICTVIAIAILFVWVVLGKRISRRGYLEGKVNFPMDTLIMRVIEVLNSLPLLLLIISLAAIFKGSMWLIVLVIGFTGWTGLARLIRAQTLQVKEMEYISSGRALGLGEWRIIGQHILPNVMPPALIVIAFSVGNAIIAESALSFLHLVDGTITWGSLLSSTMKNFEVWWAGVFPGMAIFLTVLSFNLIGEKLRDIFDPHLSG